MGNIRQLVLAGLVSAASLIVAACDEQSDDGDGAGVGGVVDVSDYLYGPGARLGYGVTVPDGAARVGPTITFDQDSGVSLGKISVVQIDGDPDATLRALLTELDRLLPDAGVEPSESRRRCWLDETNEWIQQCRLLVAGHTDDGQPLQVDVTVTPTADAEGEPLPGTTGLPQARVLVRTGLIQDVGTNLTHPRGYPYRVADQDSARWPVAPEADDSIADLGDTVPGTDDWKIADGGTPVAVVLSDPTYVIVAVAEGANLKEVATGYATSVPNEGLNTEVVASVGNRTTTSYRPDDVDGGPGAHVWAIERPGADYLFLRYWPPRS